MKNSHWQKNYNPISANCQRSTRISTPQYREDKDED